METPRPAHAHDPSLAAQFSGAITPSVPTLARCAECSGLFPPGEMMQFPGCYVCPACKPMAVRKAQDGKPIGKMWRNGKHLVCVRDHIFPSQCVKCNAPAPGEPLKRRLYWHSPALYLLFFLNPLLYLIVAGFAQKKATLHVALCDHHRHHRWKMIGIARSVALVGVVGLIIAVGAENLTIGGIGALTIVLALVFGVVAAQVVTARRIDRHTVMVGGVCKDYLDGLPEWTAR